MIYQNRGAIPYFEIQKTFPLWNVKAVLSILPAISNMATAADVSTIPKRVATRHIWLPTLLPLPLFQKVMDIWAVEYGKSIVNSNDG